MKINIQATTKEAYQLIHEGNLALADLEENGIRIDIPYCRKQYQHLSRRETWNKNKLMETKEIKQWQKIYGKTFNLNSDHQLSHLLFKVLKYEPELYKNQMDDESPVEKTLKDICYGKKN